jgi:hypothetical protein
LDCGGARTSNASATGSLDDELSFPLSDQKSSGPVPLKDVAKFSSVLELNGIAISRGLFVTNSSFVPRATTIGIKCVDGQGLAALKRKAKLRGISRLLAIASLAGAVLFTQFAP